MTIPTNTTVSGLGGQVDMQSGTVEWLEFAGRRYENVSTRFAISETGSHSQPFPDGIASSASGFGRCMSCS